MGLSSARCNTRLAQSESRLNQAQALASIGSWHLDTASGRLSLSNEACRIFGLAIGTPPTPTMLGASIYPADRAVTAARDATAGALCDLEYRVVGNGRSDGCERVERQLAPDGQVSQITGLIDDLLDRQCQLQPALRDELPI
jgi:PAS domain-containing protein